jgi:hypothetical protein
LNKRTLEFKVKDMMKKNQDYKAWFYMPVSKVTDEMYEDHFKNQEDFGYPKKK